MSYRHVDGLGSGEREASREAVQAYGRVRHVSAGEAGWRALMALRLFDYRRAGTTKRNTLSPGVYPDVSLKKACERREEARRLVVDGIEPGEKRRAEMLAGAETFEAVAREWVWEVSQKWTQGHADKIIRRLERNVFPWIGSKPIASITSPDLLSVLRRIEARGAIETAVQVSNAAAHNHAAWSTHLSGARRLVAKPPISNVLWRRP